MVKKVYIFDHHNYRAFLKAHFEYHKKKKTGLTVAKICQTLKLSHGYFSDIISGKKNLNIKLFQKLAPQLKLNETELSFLKQLILLSDAETLMDRSSAFKKIIRFQDYRSRHTDELITHELLSNWHYQVIRELTTLKNFKLDERWIWRKLKFKVSVSEIRQAIRFLENNGFIKVYKNGKCVISDRLVRADGDIMKLALTHYNTEFLDLAAKSLYLTSSKERHFLTYTVSIADESYAKIRDKLESTLKEIHQLVEKDKQKSPATKVYHIGLKAFPLNEGEES